MLPVSLDCFCFVCLRLVSCVPYVASFSGLFLLCLSSSFVLCMVVSNTYRVVVFALFVFVLCLVYPMLPVSLDCFCFVCLRLVSCVPYVASFSGLFLLCLSSSCVLCTLCCQFLTNKAKTIQRNWQHRVHKTQDEDKQNKNNPEKLAT